MNDLSPFQKWAIDAAERMGKTFVQGFILAWLVFQDGQWDAFISVENLQAGLVGGVLSLATSAVSSRVGSHRTAAALPSVPDTDKG